VEELRNERVREGSGYYESAGSTKPGKVKEYLGPNGEILHETAAQHAHRSLLEHKAKIEGAYTNPFTGATNVHRSRTDQGVDFSFAGSLGAVGGGQIVNIAKDPGGFGTEIVEQLTSGKDKGQYVYYGLETGATNLARKGMSVRGGQTLAHGLGHGGIELGFASGASGAPLTPFAPGASHDKATAGGEAFSKFLASIGKTGTNLQIASSEFATALKQKLSDLISPAAQRALHGHVEAAGHDRAEASAYGGYAGEVGSYLSRAQTKWGRQKVDLTSASGKATQKARDEAPIFAAQTERKYFQREVAALQKEAREWGKIRDSYRKFARHATGPGAKKEALKKPSEFDGKVKQAQKEAVELGGQIAATEEAEEAAQAVLGALPGEVAAAEAEKQGGDLSEYQAAINKIDLEERAGYLTPEAAKAAREATATSAKAGGYGALSAEGQLQVAGDLREFQKALESATNAQEGNTQAVEASTKAILEREQAARRLAEIENGTIVKAMADLISGQIGGVDYHGRQIAGFEKAHRELASAQLGMFRALLENARVLRRLASLEGKSSARSDVENGASILREDGRVECIYREGEEEYRYFDDQLPALIEALERKLAGPPSWV
jgi:hypothetical protein